MHNRTANVQLITTKKHKGYKNIYFNNIILKTRHLLLLIALISVSKYALCSENKSIENENTFKNIVHKYILPNENQIFGNKKHLISIFGGYDYGNLNAKYITTKEVYYISLYSGQYIEDVWRKNGEIAISYSLPTKFWWFNGRFSFGIFSWIMQQNINNRNYYGEKVKGTFINHTIGFEGIQELIFGHKNLYFTIGVGVSYQFVVGTSNLKTNNNNFNDTFYERKPKILWNNTPFNFVVKASIGHHFDCGLILEINWKHYSNGGLHDANWGLNFLGGTIGYVF